MSSLGEHVSQLPPLEVLRRDVRSLHSTVIDTRYDAGDSGNGTKAHRKAQKGGQRSRDEAVYSVQH